jgi:hypothetical protein|tara:strand:+ start:4878 stop:5066 length:189 start_codon:yes stop_codon:yes gene_type:complete
MEKHLMSLVANGQHDKSLKAHQLEPTSNIAFSRYDIMEAEIGGRDVKNEVGFILLLTSKGKI